MIHIPWMIKVMWLSRKRVSLDLLFFCVCYILGMVFSGYVLEPNLFLEVDGHVI